MSLFIFINVRLLFRNVESNIFRVIGAVNVYLLFALMGAFAFEILSRVDISRGEKLSAIETTTWPDKTMARKMITDSTFIGISIAIADSSSKTKALRACAVNLHTSD